MTEVPLTLVGRKDLPAPDVPALLDWLKGRAPVRPSARPASARCPTSVVAF